MKKQILIAAALLCGLKVGAQERGFTIKGDVEGLESSQVYLLLGREQGVDTVASAEVENGKFEMKGRLEEPALCLLSTGPQQGIRIFVENTDIQVKGTVPDIAISGSRSHEEMEKMARLNPELNKLQQELNVLRESYREATLNEDTASARAIDAEAQPLLDRLEEAQQQYETQLIEYIRTQPASYATPYMILATFQEPDPNIFLPVFEKFPEGVQGSLLGRVLKERLDISAPTAVGRKAPEIRGLNPEGEPVALSEVRGKLTLIDFWASWCAPCRRENPNVVRLYEKYYPKGFRILGVSLDTNAEQWKKAIRDDGLEWAHVSDLKGWKSALSAPYAVNAIPHTLLIDENGMIVAKNLRGEALEEKLAEVFGE